MPSFEEILKMPSGEIKSPQAIPHGTYHCLVEGPPRHDKSSQKQTDFLEFKFRILSAGKDVDAAQAAEQQVVGKYLLQQYYFPSDGQLPWRLREFLVDNLGLDDEDGAKPLEQLIHEAPGQQVLVKVRHELAQDGKRVFHRVDSTAHV